MMATRTLISSAFPPYTDDQILPKSTTFKPNTCLIVQPFVHCSNLKRGRRVGRVLAYFFCTASQCIRYQLWNGGHRWWVVLGCHAIILQTLLHLLQDFVVVKIIKQSVRRQNHNIAFLNFNCKLLQRKWLKIRQICWDDICICLVPEHLQENQRMPSLADMENWMNAAAPQIGRYSHLCG